MAFFGNETAKEALESQAKYDKMIAQQEKQATEAAVQTQLIQQLLWTMQETNRSIQSIADRPVTIKGGSSFDISQSTSIKEGRHTSIPSSPFVGLGR